MYYVAINSYATATSVGFANTWNVIGFATKHTRDNYVKRATDKATQAIKSTEVRKYGCKPRQVSYYDASGSFFTVDKNGPNIDAYRTGATIDPVTAKPITDGVWSHG